MKGDRAACEGGFAGVELHLSLEAKLCRNVLTTPKHLDGKDTILAIATQSHFHHENA